MGIIHLRNRKDTEDNQDRQDKPVLSADTSELRPERAHEERDEADVAYEQAIREEDPAILCEDIGRRRENVKFFKLNDGTMRAVVYDEPVHYYDESARRFRTIDNSLVDSGKKLETRRGVIHTALAKDASRKVELTKGDKKIEWEFMPQSPALGLSPMAVRAHSADQTPKTLASPGGGAVYENVQPDVDIEYVMSAGKVKENIIVKAPQEECRYSFKLKTNGLSLRTAEDDSCIELYSESSDASGESAETVEFRIPTPFMFDAAGVRSDEVYYEVNPLQGGEYLFTVIADKDWLNLPDRAYPVTIDPQIETISKPKWLDYQVYRKSMSGADTPVKVSSDYIRSFKDSTYSYHTEISIHKTMLNIDLSRITKAYLVLKTYSFSNIAHLKKHGDVFTISGKIVGVKMDISRFFSDDAADYVKLLLPSQNENSQFYVDGEYAPSLELEYVMEENTQRTVQTIDLAGCMEGEADLTTGEMISRFCDIDGGNSLLGLGVSHIFKKSAYDYSCGKNVRLSIHESLTGNWSTPSETVYTDAQGIKHRFKEEYYWLNSDKQRVYIPDKRDIVVDLHQKLTYNGNEVFVEHKTDTGWKLIAPLENFKNIDFLEQRQQEIKTLEETVRLYQDYFYKFVCMRPDMTICHILNYDVYGMGYSQKDFDKFMENETFLVLSKEEALNFKSIYIQKEPLQRQSDKLTENIRFHESQKDNKDNERLEELRAEKKAIDDQRNLIDERIDYMKRIKPQLRQNAFNMFKEYKNKEAELETLRNQMPKQYLTDGQITKVFRGKLLAVYDNYGNSAVIDYDKKNRVKRICEGDSKEIIFDYNTEGLLSSITDARGRVTRYGYTDGKLTTINLPGHKSIHITYAGNEITEILSSDFLKTKLSYISGQLKVVEQVSTIRGVTPSTRWEPDGYECILSSDSFSYLGGETTVTRDGRVQHYFFNTRGSQSAYYEVVDGRKQETEFYVRPHIAASPDDKVELEYSIKAKKGAKNYLEDYASRVGTTEFTGIPSSNLSAEIKNYVFSAYATGYVDTDVTRYQTEFDEYKGAADKPRFEISAKVYYDCASDEFIMSFEGETHNRQCVAIPVTLRSDSKGKTLMPESIVLKLTAPSDQFVFDTFCFAAAEWTYNQFDKIGNCVHSESGWNELDIKAPAEGGARTFEKLVTDYTYDDDRRLISERTARKVTTSWGVKEKTAVAHYSYNSNGSLVRTERHVEDEVLTEGAEIEESIFNEKGRLIKTVAYNTLDSGSKFYTENVLSENGQIAAEKNEIGEAVTQFDYVEGTNIIRSEMSGSRVLSYGRDIDDRVTEITASTESGEENSTKLRYNLGMLTGLESGNNAVEYVYDNKRRLRVVTLNSENYLRYDYHENMDINGVICDEVSTELAGGETFEIYKDKRGNLRRTTCGGYVQAEWQYDPDKELNTAVTDHVAGFKGVKTYDSLNRMTEYAYNRLPESTMDLDSVTESCAFNSEGFLTRKRYSYNGTNHTYDYAYRNNLKGDLESIKYDNRYTFSPKNDLLGRLSERVVSTANKPICGEYISYRKRGDHTTNMPATIRYGAYIGDDYVISDSLKYSYDDRGNITAVSENGELSVRYTYDAIDRLVREDNKRLGITQLWDYDNNGNITSKRSCNFTLKESESITEEETQTSLYHYDAKSDRLIELNGQTIVYDAVGNPTQYGGKAATWAKGRQLIQLGNDRFVYNGLGQRVQKNDTKYTYTSDGRLLREYTADGAHRLDYIYNDCGIAGIEYNDTIYFYRKNAQGDITALLDKEGHTVVRYIYNAWGEHAVLNPDGTENPSEAFIGNINPIRYRGYYYDIETGLYFISSRYYDSEIGRFISADDISVVATMGADVINGLNLYAYCLNNPVNRVDPTGYWNWKKFFKTLGVALVGAVAVAGLVVASVLTGGAAGAVILGAAIGAGIGGGMGLASAAVSGDNLWAGMFGGMLTGAAIGATGALGGLAGTGILAGGAASAAFGIGVGSSFLAGMGRYTIQTLANGREFCVGRMFLDGGLTAIEAATSFGMGAAFSAAGGWSKINNLPGSKVEFAGGGKATTLALMGIRVFYTNVFSKGPTWPFRYAFL